MVRRARTRGPCPLAPVRPAGHAGRKFSEGKAVCTRQLILSIFAALLAVPVVRADEAEDRAVKVIEKLGGKV